MELDSFFSNPRWRILEIIAKKPSSPLEISHEMNTSVAYISQQLKLLETAQLITKKRTGFSDKGKPRTVFSLKGDMAYLSILTKDLQKKNLMYLSDRQNAILKIWSIDNPVFREELESLYFSFVQ